MQRVIIHMQTYFDFLFIPASHYMYIRAWCKPRGRTEPIRVCKSQLHVAKQRLSIESFKISAVVFPSRLVI